MDFRNNVHQQLLTHVTLKPRHSILVIANAWHGRLEAIIIKPQMQIYWI